MDERGQDIERFGQYLQRRAPGRRRRPAPAAGAPRRTCPTAADPVRRHGPSWRSSRSIESFRGPDAKRRAGPR